MEDLFIWIGLAAIVIVFLVAIIGRYVTVSPDTALIVSGSFLGNGTNVFTDKENNKMKIVRGGGTFLWPIFQEGKRLSLMSSKLEVGASEVYTKQGVPISATGSATVSFFFFCMSFCFVLVCFSPTALAEPCIYSSPFP